MGARETGVDSMSPQEHGRFWQEQARVLLEIEHEKDRVEESTRHWWSVAHMDDTAYHQQFRGYCHICRES